MKVLASNSMRAVLAELLPQFERANGRKVEISYDPAKITLRRIEQGESADAVILNASAIDDLVASGKLDPKRERVVLARCGVGVAVRAGAAKPDIRTVDAFKRALLAAKSIAHTSEGASGMHFSKLIERLGIAGEIKAKARTQPGGLVAELIVNGTAELAIQQIPELLAVPGIDLVGPLPAELQLISVVSAAVFANARDAQGAQALLEFVSSPAAKRVIEARGLQPG